MVEMDFLTRLPLASEYIHNDAKQLFKSDNTYTIFVFHENHVFYAAHIARSANAIKNESKLYHDSNVFELLPISPCYSLHIYKCLILRPKSNVKLTSKALVTVYA